MSEGFETASNGNAIRALIFDMDGLLVDSESVAAAALTRFIELHGRAVRPGTLEHALGRRLPEAVAIIAEMYEMAGNIADLVARYDQMRLEALRGHVRPMRGAVEVLAFARAAGLRLGLATSSQRSHADLTLSEAGLDGRFDAEATGDEVQRGKPAPDLFLLAARRLGVAPAACLVIEDAPAGLAAAAASIRRIWVPNELTMGLLPTVAVDGTFANLLEVISWLEAAGIVAANDARIT